MYAGVGIKYLEILKMKIRCVEVEIVFGQNSLYPTVVFPIPTGHGIAPQFPATTERQCRR